MVFEQRPQIGLKSDPSNHNPATLVLWVRRASALDVSYLIGKLIINF